MKKRPVTIELDETEKAWFVEALEERRTDAQRRRDEAADEISAIDRKIEQLLGKAASKVSAKTPKGRVKRGESEKLVLRFLKQLNGSGASITEINKATGTRYGTVNRLMKIFKKSGKVTQATNRKWQLATA